MEYINLIGVEDIRAAGYNIKNAAEYLDHSATNLTYALERHQNWMDDWLLRFEFIIEKINAVN